jgi:hypothetical protein
MFPLLRNIVQASCSVLWVGESSTDYLIQSSSRETVKSKVLWKNGYLWLLYFLNKWKHTNVIPIPKPNTDLINSLNFRSIRFLSAFSKMFERIILKRFNEFLSDYNLLPNHQFGFCVSHSSGWKEIFKNQSVWCFSTSNRRSTKS